MRLLKFFIIIIIIKGKATNRTRGILLHPAVGSITTLIRKKKRNLRNECLVYHTTLLKKKKRNL